MATTPTFDPNKLASHDFDAATKAYTKLNADDAQPLLNRANQMALPPGSTFKVVTAAAAIEHEGYDATRPSPAARLPAAAHQRRDRADRQRGPGLRQLHQGVSFRQAMENSCNTTFAQLAVQVGAENMAETAEGFGFNRVYFDDLQGTNGKSTTAISTFPNAMDKAQTGQSGFGQFEVRATPLQMAMVAAGLANNGSVMNPYLVDEVQSADSDTVDTTPPSELSKAVSPSTAAR